MKEKLYVPLSNSLINDNTRDIYFEQLSKLDVHCLFIGINQEEIFLSEKELFEHIKVLKKNVSDFKQKGYTVGVWVPGFGFGGVLSQKLVEKTKDYVRLRSVNGVQNNSAQMFCPESEAFMKDYLAFIKAHASTGCDLLMIDDDLCLSVRPGIGCFCDNHIRLLEEELGESLKDADLPKLFFTGGKNKYRDAWITVMGNTLRRFAKRVRSAVDEINPSIRVGFCAGFTSWDIEGVDALELTKILAGNTAPFLRFTGAPYWASPLIDRFAGQPLCAIIEETRAQEEFCRGSGVEVFFEADSFPRPRYAVPSSMIECFTLPLYASGGMGDLSYLFDYIASPNYETGYLRHRLYNMPMYEFIDKHFNDKNAYGVRVYHQMRKIERAELPKQVNEGAIMQMHFNRGAEMLANLGIPTLYGQDADCGIAFGEEARYIEKLPKKLVLDVKGALILGEKGVDIGVISYEDAPIPITEIVRNERHFLWGQYSSKYYKFNLKDDAKVLGKFENNDNVFPSCYTYKSGDTEFFIYTFEAYSMSHRSTILNSYERTEELCEFFGCVPYMERSPGVYQICKKAENGETAILLVNISIDPIIDGCLHLDKAYNNAEYFGAEGELKGDTINFKTIIPPYGACAIILK